MRMRSWIMAVAVIIGGASVAQAQVPVVDSATLSQATQTASNTAQIMNTNQQIMTTVKQTLEAVTGNRQTGNLATAALGSGFSMGGAPDLSSILGGGQMSWGNLGSYGAAATAILNGLNLVKTLTGATDASAYSGTDKAYMGAVNTSAAVTALIQGTQQSASARSSAFTAAAQQIGTATDIKGSIDQNSQLQVQTGLTINEMIGVLNAANSALNAQQQQELAAQAKAAKFWGYDADQAQMVIP